MDSSRSGLLSTLLMTLPLIVVPAIALLRPPGQPAGISTAPLDASESSDDDFLSDFDELDRRPPADDTDSEAASDSGSPEFDNIFAEEPTETDKRKDRTGPGPGTPSDADPFMPSEPAEDQSATVDPEIPRAADGGAERMVEQLKSMGALRTMWFEAGPKAPVGFAAFFRGQTELMRIRFEAVGQTHEECAGNVIDQVTRWQALQAAQNR